MAFLDSPYPTQYSAGGSFASSTSRGSSGSQYPAAALARIAQLYPEVYRRFSGSAPITSWSDLLSETAGPSTPFPEITMGGVYTPQQVQSGINNIYARSASGAAGDIARQRRQLAGRGFGTMSPLMQELSAQIAGRAKAGAAQTATGFSLDAARANAEQLLRSQQAGVGRAAAISEAESRRRQIALARQGQGIERENALLNALAVYNQPLPFSKQRATSESSSSYGSTGGYSYF